VRTHRTIKTVQKITEIKHAKTDRQTEKMQLTVSNNHNN